MQILGIDPGPQKTAYCLFEEGKIIRFDHWSNEDMLKLAREWHHNPDKPQVFIEMIASYGMSVSKSVFETCVVIGQLKEAFETSRCKVSLIYRKDVKMNLCGQMKANDSNIRTVLIDRFGVPGTKKNPGNTYGITGDCWSALAVAVTAYDRHLE